MHSSSKWSLSLRFPTKALNAHLSSLIPGKCNVYPVLLGWSPAQYLVRSTDHESRQYAVGYTRSYLNPYRPKYLPQRPVLKQPPSILFCQCRIPSFTPI